MTTGNASLDAALADVAAAIGDGRAEAARRMASALVTDGAVAPQETCSWVVPVHEDLACDDRVLGPGAIATIRTGSGVVPGLVVALADRTVLAVEDDGEVTSDEIPADESIRASEMWVETGDRRHLGLELVMGSSDGPWRRLMYLDGDIQSATTVAWHDRLVDWFVDEPADIAGRVVRRCPTCHSYLEDDEQCPNCVAPKAVGGWHADPWGRHELRFYDGQAWTAHVSDRGVVGIDSGADATAPSRASDGESQAASSTSPTAREASSPADVLEQLERLNALRAAGGVTEDEFVALKAAILARG